MYVYIYIYIHMCIHAHDQLGRRLDAAEGTLFVAGAARVAQGLSFSWR